MKLNLPVIYDRNNNTNIHRIKSKNGRLFLTFYQALFELLDNNNNNKLIFNMLDRDNQNLLIEIKDKYKEKPISESEIMDNIKKIEPSSCTEIKKEIKKYNKIILTLPIFQKKSTIFHRLTRIN